MTPFKLLDAASAAEAVALLSASGADAMPLAAGGDLLEFLKEGIEGPALRLPSVLINLATARDMATIVQDPAGVRIGAMTTLADLAAFPKCPPMLKEAIGRVASPQLRARTTVGGNLLQRPRCLYFRHPDILCFKKGGGGCPAVGGPPEAYPGALQPGVCHAGHPSDLAPALIALEADVELLGPEGMRRLPLLDLYDGAGDNAKAETRLKRHEILVAIQIPEAARLQAFEKVSPRSANEFAWVSVGIALRLHAGQIEAARVAIGGISPAPVLWPGANALLGSALDELDCDAISSAAVPRTRLAEQHPARVAAFQTALRRAFARIARSNR